MGEFVRNVLLGPTPDLGESLHPHKIPRRCTGIGEGEKLRISGLELPVRELCSDSIFLTVFDLG